MIVKLFILDKSKRFSFYEPYLKWISYERQQRISNLNFEKDKVISILTELIIKNEVSKILNIPYSDIAFEHNSYGKPFIKDVDNFDFSISHSADYIAFIYDHSPIGIDIEKIKPCNLKLAKRFFTIDELDFILNSSNKDTSFFKIWTSKEAYVKMLGLGLYKSFKSFNVLDNNLKDYFTHIQIDDYYITICNNHYKKLIDIEILSEKDIIPNY